MEQEKTQAIGKRYLSGATDLLFIFIFVILFYLVAGFPLSKSIVNFDDNIIKQKEVTLQVYNHMYDTHLYIKGENDKPLNTEVIYKRYVNSLLKDGEKDESGNYYDPLAYYYLQFRTDIDVNYFNTEILKISAENKDNIFVLRDNNNALTGKLKTSDNFRQLLKAYDEGSTSDEAKTANDQLVGFFEKAWFKAVQLEKSEATITGYITTLSSLIKAQGYSIGLPAIILYLIAMMVNFLIIPLIFKGRTLGNLIIKTYLKNEDDTDVKSYKVIIRAVLFTILYFFIPFVAISLCLGIQNSSLVPLFTIGSVDVHLFTVSMTLLLLALINLFILTFSKFKQSFIDKVTFTYLVNKDKEDKENAQGLEILDIDIKN